MLEGEYGHGCWRVSTDTVLEEYHILLYTPLPTLPWVHLSITMLGYTAAAVVGQSPVTALMRTVEKRAVADTRVTVDRITNFERYSEICNARRTVLYQLSAVSRPFSLS